MTEDGKTIELKNKVSELKQRLNQMYTQFFIDSNKGRVFQSEFSLYLKACENARNEISESIKLQYATLKIGLIILIGASALTVYLFKLYVVFGMLTLLGLGFFACSFMYLILFGEIRITRARGFCDELEKYFKHYRWSTETNEKMELPILPLWEEYASKWNKDIFAGGHYEEKTLYVPFRIVIAFVDLLALIYLIQSFIVQQPYITWTVLIACCVLWGIAVIAQILIIHSIINKVGIKQEGIDKDSLEFKKKEISWKPETWVNILRLFLVLDIIFNKESKKNG